jgi:hypothetical protein
MNYPTFVAVENVATKTPRHGYNKEALRKNILEFILDLFMCTIPSTPMSVSDRCKPLVDALLVLCSILGI